MSKMLGIALFGGVSVWAAHLLLSYLLADLGCRGDTGMLLAGRHLLTLVAGAAVIVVTLAVRPWRTDTQQAADAASSSLMHGQPVTPSEAERPLLAWVALLLNGMFLFAIVLAGTTNFFLAPCV